MHEIKNQSSESQEAQRRLEFLEFTPADGIMLGAVRDDAMAFVDGFIEELYDFLTSHEGTRDNFQSAEHVERVKRLQVRYFQGLFSGEYGGAYYKDRQRIGQAHERIGLRPEWYLGTYSYVLRKLIPAFRTSMREQPERLDAVLDALIKVVFYDMGIAIDTYIDAMKQREDATQEEFMSALHHAVGSVDASTSSLQTAIDEQTQSSHKQSVAVSELTSTLSELRQTSAHTLAQAQAMLASAETSVRTVDEGRSTLADSVDGMKAIRDRVENIQDRILALSDQTQQIGEIIATVNEIAEQSKLLAFNASIEATRAGEFGKSFAVVASEMRDLAEQSKQATKEVRKLLSGIREATNSAVVATEEGYKKAEEGQKYADRASALMEELGSVISQSAEAGRSIADTTRQQEEGVSQAADAMVQFDETVRKNAESMSELQAVSSKLQETTEGLNGFVKEFEVNKDKPRAAEYRHAGSRAA